jgi:uncharacterized membrane-anchored protein
MFRGLVLTVGLVVSLLVGRHAAAAAPKAAPKAASSAAEVAPSPSASTEDAPGPSLWEPGPAHVDLGHDLSLDVPANDRFLPKEPAGKALEKMGHFENDSLLGIVADGGEHGDWFVVLTYEPEGYIKDDESIDANELLSSMREGTKQMNEERQKRGFKPLSLDGWSDPPRYDKAKHELIWALIVSDPDGKSVNYNTRILGRRGYASVNLVTDPAELAAHKADAAALLTNTHFANGSRYQDFDSKTDKVAEYGLAGLIMAGAGLGAMKLIKIGLIAKFWNVILAALIAGKKLVVAALVGGGALVKRLFGSKKRDELPG